jgi:PAS domain-containing protein
MSLLMNFLQVIDRRTGSLSLPRWSFSTALACSIAFSLVATIVSTRHPDLLPGLLPPLIVFLSSAVLLVILSLMTVLTEQNAADLAFRNTDREFSSIFHSVLDGILILDNEGCCLDANPAAIALLRLPADKLIGERIFHFLADRTPFSRNWRSLLQNKGQLGSTQLVTGDGKNLFVDFTAAADYLPGRHVLILSDVTSRKKAEMKIHQQLDVVDTARSEAAALRKAILALTRNLAMDSVLDTLMECISELIPYDIATVLFVECDTELLVARESPRIDKKRIGLTLRLSENVFVQRVLVEKQARLLADLREHSEWRDIQPFNGIQSWLAVPLIAHGRVLGILSLGAYVPFTLTHEHLRLAKSLAIPAVAAIENARVHERAEIYAAELAVRLEELRNAQNALQGRPDHPSNSPSPSRVFPQESSRWRALERKRDRRKASNHS